MSRSFDIADYILETQDKWSFDVTDAKIQFALDLAALMEENGISRKDLADRIGVALSRVTKILSGDANLTLETMVQAVRAAGGTFHMRITPEGRHAKWLETAFTQPVYDRSKSSRAETFTVAERSREFSGYRVDALKEVNEYEKQTAA